jgi:hypothetical protein
MTAREVPDLPEWVEVGKPVALVHYSQGTYLAKVIKVQKLHVIVESQHGSERKFSRLRGLTESTGSWNGSTTMIDPKSDAAVNGLLTRDVDNAADAVDRWRRTTRSRSLSVEDCDAGIKASRVLTNLLRRKRELLIDDDLPE